MTNILTETVHNLESLLEGKSTFSEVAADEGAAIQAAIDKLPAELQAGANILNASFKAGESALVGIGLTSLGPVLSQSPATDATAILNLLSMLGVPTAPPLSVAEQAALTAGLTGVKAFLDRLGLHIMTGGQVSIDPAPAAVPQA